MTATNTMKLTSIGNSDLLLEYKFLTKQNRSNRDPGVDCFVDLVALVCTVSINRSNSSPIAKLWKEVNFLNEYYVRNKLVSRNLPG